MGLIIGVVSQKGAVGKHTLARAPVGEYALAGAIPEKVTYRRGSDVG